MGKKAKGKKKAPAKAAKTVEPPKDRFTTMTLPELHEEIEESKRLLAEVRERRGYFQLERDQVQMFYNVVHQDVVNTEADLKNLESQIEKTEEAHHNDIRMYQQKVKHLEYVHATTMSQVKADGEASRQTEDDEHCETKKKLSHQRDALEADLRELMLQQEDEVKTLKESQGKEIRKLREEFQRAADDLQQRYENAKHQLQGDLNLRRKMEIHDLEERKNEHINVLISNHEKAFTEMRDYYNSVTKDNVSLIRALKEELSDLRTKSVENDGITAQIQEQNEKLSRPLEQVIDQVKTLQKKLANYSKEKESLEHARSRLTTTEKRLSKLTNDYESLTQQFEQVEAERDELYATYEQTMAAVYNQEDRRNETLQVKLGDAEDDLHRKETQFTEILREANLDTVVLDNLTNKLDEVLDSKNSQIAHVKYEVAKVEKALADAVRIYTARLTKFGIPPEELEFPLPPTNIPIVGAASTTRTSVGLAAGDQLLSSSEIASQGLASSATSAPPSPSRLAVR